MKIVEIMGIETDQTLVIISTVAGCLETLRQTHAFARVDIKRAIDTGFNACRTACKSWPGMFNKWWVKSKRVEFNDFVANHPDRGYSSAALVCMCDRLIITLMERDAGLAGKIAMLEPIHRAVRTIHDFCDRDGANFPAFEKSDELVDALYEIIEMRVAA